MIGVNEIKNGMTITYEDNLYQVMDTQHVKPGKGAAFVKAKLKNMRSGAITEITFNYPCRKTAKPLGCNFNGIRVAVKSDKLSVFQSLCYFKRMPCPAGCSVDINTVRFYIK